MQLFLLNETYFIWFIIHTPLQFFWEDRENVDVPFFLRWIVGEGGGCMFSSLFTASCKQHQQQLPSKINSLLNCVHKAVMTLLGHMLFTDNIGEVNVASCGTFHSRVPARRLSCLPHHCSWRFDCLGACVSSQKAYVSFVHDRCWNRIHGSSGWGLHLRHSDVWWQWETTGATSPPLTGSRSILNCMWKKIPTYYNS